MPNLKEKIGAQLKGVKKEELKDYLSRTGYAHQKTTQAKKVKSADLPSNKIHKKSPSKTFVLISIVVGIVLLLWVMDTLPFFPIEQTASKEQVDAEEILPFYITVPEFLDRTVQERFLPQYELSFRRVNIPNDSWPVPKYVAEWVHEDIHFFLAYATEKDNNDIELFDLTFTRPQIDADRDNILNSLQEIIKFEREEVFRCKGEKRTSCVAFWNDPDGFRLAVYVDTPSRFSQEIQIPYGPLQFKNMDPEEVTITTTCLIPYKGRLLYNTDKCTT